MADAPIPKPQKMFDSWPEPPTMAVPLYLHATVLFRRVLDYDGTDTGLIEILLPDAVRGTGSLKLPRSMFSDEINGKLPEIPKREE